MPSIEDGALSGAFVVRHREIFRELFGQETVRRIFAEMSPEAARTVSEATMTSWIPVGVASELFDVAARCTNRDPAQLHREVGALASERMIKTVWRILVRFTTDAQLISQTPVVYRKAWNRGTLTARMASPRHAIVTLTSWPGVPDFTIRGVQVAIEQVLLLAGRKNVRVTFERTSDGVTEDATWS